MGNSSPVSQAPGPALDRPRPQPEYYADAAARAVAYALDAVVVAILAFVAAIVVSTAFGPVLRFGAGEITVDRDLALANAVVTTVLSALYFVLSWTRARATLGQRFLRMSVGQETDGARLPAARALARWAVLGVPLGVAAVLTTVLPGVGDAVVTLLALAWLALLLASIARSPKKQGLHDRAAGSVVVRCAIPVEWVEPTGGASSRVR